MFRTIEVSEETYESIKDQLQPQEQIDVSGFEDMIGKKFFFRSVTYHHVGLVKKVWGNIIELEDASWVADSGRFMNAIKEGTLKEVEPSGTVFINMAANIDFLPWNHPLPTKQK